MQEVIKQTAKNNIKKRHVEGFKYKIKQDLKLNPVVHLL